jgi:hypothetical protein
MGAVIRRAHEAVAGKTVEFEGERVRPSVSDECPRRCPWLAITELDMRGGLRVVLNPEARRERNVRPCRTGPQQDGACVAWRKDG